jgi:hypothetical protein
VKVPLEHIVPPGGFHYVDRSGGDLVRIEGGSDDEVAAKVLKHRLSNGRVPGDPLQEIIAERCEKYPHFCRDLTPEEVPARQFAANIGGGMATRAAAWLARFVQFSRADRGVSLTESQRRADICAACPHNEEFRGGCGSCVDNINRLFFVWRRDRALPREAELKACKILGQHNGAAVLADRLPTIDSDANAKLPAQCWRKTAT